MQRTIETDVAGIPVRVDYTWDDEYYGLTIGEIHCDQDLLISESVFNFLYGECALDMYLHLEQVEERDDTDDDTDR